MTPDDGEDKRKGGRDASSLIERAMHIGARSATKTRPDEYEPVARQGSAARAKESDASIIEKSSSAPARPATEKSPAPRPVEVMTATAEKVASSLPVEAEAAPSALPREERGRTIELDFDQLSAKGFITPNSPRTRTTEEFRLIKRGILQGVSAARKSGVRHPNLIMVTSAIPSEGKTFNAVNLAISIASEPDYRALLIDADLIRPSVFRTLGAEPQRGLIDIIENREDSLADLLVHTNVDGLTLLDSGTLHPMAAELLASERMQDFIDEIARRYTDRIIIFDAPPVLITSEPTVLASLMSQVVFVIEAERTPRTQVREALDLIGPGPNVGLVLNKARSQLGSRKFGEYYKAYTRSR
jgi:receptor protein-tyrosine kinase